MIEDAPEMCGLRSSFSSCWPFSCALLLLDLLIKSMDFPRYVFSSSKVNVCGVCVCVSRCLGIKLRAPSGLIGSVLLPRSFVRVGVKGLAVLPKQPRQSTLSVSMWI